MQRREPVFFDETDMGAGAIALVLSKIVLRVLLMSLDHKPITVDLGDNGSERNNWDLFIPLNDGLHVGEMYLRLRQVQSSVQKHFSHSWV